jgi:hypothetical protein
MGVARNAYEIFDRNHELGTYRYKQEDNTKLYLNRRIYAVLLTNCKPTFNFFGFIPPLWSSGYKSRGPGFDSRHYQIF